LDRPPLLSFAQNGEDVVLERAFAEQNIGFYVDIGACHPVEDSVTLHFYQRGWRGVNVEPDRALHAAFVDAREHDANVCAAVGRTRGRIDFYPTNTRGHGTLSPSIAAARGRGRPCEKVPQLPLSDIIDLYGPDSGIIDFLKIDVEGWEADVIASGDWNRHRPRVVLVEAVDDVARPTHEIWEAALLGAGYRYGMFDGLNRFYCRDEDADLLLPRLAAPASVLDRWTRASDAHVHEAYRKLRIQHAQVVETQAATLAVAEQEAEQKIAAIQNVAAAAASAHSQSLSAALQRLAEADERANSLAGELEQARADLARIEDELRTRCNNDEVRIVELSRARAAAASSLRREEIAEARLAELEVDAMRRNADIASLAAQLEQTRQNHEGWLEAIRRSTSWRVTKPLRVVGRAVKRRVRR
jgi:FkbM family methyltransferase